MLGLGVKTHECFLWSTVLKNSAEMVKYLLERNLSFIN